MHADRAVASDDAESRERRQHEFMGRAARFGGIVMVCLFIWLLTGGPFWPVWVIAIGGVRLAMRARHAYATADEY